MKRTAQKEQTRHHLLNMAYGAFAAKGFLATKTLDIAVAAGVSHGTLFMHFPTKEELLIKTIDAFGIRIGTKLEELARNKGTAREVLKAHLETIEEYESFYANLVTEGPLLPDSVRNRVFMIQSGVGSERSTLHYSAKELLLRIGALSAFFARSFPIFLTLFEKHLFAYNRHNRERKH